MTATDTLSKNIGPLAILKYTGIATGFLGLAFLMLQLLNLAIFWMFYSSVFEKVRELGGFEDSITGIITIFVTAVAIFVAPISVGALFTGDRKKLLIIAGVASLWFAGTFALSRPRDGEYFNRLTGSPQYKYSVREDGKIYLHNIGYNFDPKTGVKLDLFTAEVAKKHPEVFNPKPPEIIAPAPTPTPKPQIAERASDAEIVVKKRAVSVDGSRVAEIVREPEATPVPVATPTPRPKTLMEVAQNAPVCEASIKVYLNPETAPRKDVWLNTSCWSGLITIDMVNLSYSGYLFTRFAAKSDDGNLLYLLEDGRIVKDLPRDIYLRMSAAKETRARIRLLGSGVARVAVAFSPDILEELLTTPVHNPNPENS